MLQRFVEFIICYKANPLLFYRVQISINFKTIILKLLVLSVGLGTRSISSSVRETTQIKNIHNFRIKSGIFK